MARFFLTFECKRSTGILYVFIKYCFTEKTNLISGSYYDLVRFIDNLAVNFFFGDPVDIMDVLVHL